ncbi:sensor histidine kinase [Streptomyces sp. CA-243310]|uniref:sensor histidine kinase n=1 Tax=Streptomyces sp. CA-243310 TaxID=3240056 RepID=UPI003D94679F
MYTLLSAPLILLAVWMFANPSWPWVLLLIAMPFGFMPWVRPAGELRAQFLLTPHERGSPGSVMGTAPSARWGDRWRTLWWLEMRLVVTGAAMFATAVLALMTFELIAPALGQQLSANPTVPFIPTHGVAALLAPVPLVVLIVVVVLLGEMITSIARRLSGPSAAERLSALETRTGQSWERTRIARELHDSIGHALTVAVTQAGAARAAADPDFTDRALHAIEETGRAALEDLERVLLVLRESVQPASQRPTLAEADRLPESARVSGVAVDARLTGSMEKVPGPVTREGYRILREAPGNALRHRGPVPDGARDEVTTAPLDPEVTNPLSERPTFAPGGRAGCGRGPRSSAGKPKPVRTGAVGE